jgi:surface protein
VYLVFFVYICTKNLSQEKRSEKDMKLFKLHLILFVLVLIQSGTTEAKVIGQEAAYQKAKGFIESRTQKGIRRALQQSLNNIHIAESRKAFYVFNIGESDGFVLVGGDDLMPDILGYSDNGHYVPDHIPCNLQALLQGYEEEYASLKEPSTAKHVTRSIINGDPIAPMLECQWNQEAPYNDQCPKGCPTGCVATAMAQIMYYYKWPMQTTKTIPSYVTSSMKITIPAIEITTIDWDNMLPTYSYEGTETPLQKEAVAKLMKLCGASVKMNYKDNGAGSPAFTRNAYTAFMDYFDYEANYLDRRYDVHSDELWLRLIYNELKNKRPVFYGGPTKIGSHAMVIDGYDSGDYFHINFGWGGLNDGFYLFPRVEGGRAQENVIIGLKPSSLVETVPYAVKSNDMLTIYYDENMKRLGGVIFSEVDRSDITHIKISPSMKDYHPYSLSGFFKDFKNLTSIEGLENLNTDFCMNMNSMFSGCSSLTSIDLSHLNTSNVDGMGFMFYGCSSLKELDFSHFDTSVANEMMCMFHSCSSLSTLDLSHFNTSNVRYMQYMFTDCSSLTTLDLSHFDTSSAEYMEYMFYGCSSLTSLDVSHFNTLRVQSMSRMFSGCSSLPKLDLSSFHTPRTFDMDYMFEGCSSLSSLDLSHFNATEMTSMERMFYGCSSLSSLDLSTFNTSNVTTMEQMFTNCSALTTIYVSDEWRINDDMKGEYVFRDCNNLVGGMGTHYDESHIDYTYARIDGGESSPGYLTYKVFDQGIRINNTNFPNSDFCGFLTCQDYGIDRLLSKEEIDSITSLNLSGMEIDDLTGIAYFPALTELNISNNLIKDEAMDNLIADLPNARDSIPYKLYVLDASEESEGNEITESQIAKAIAKGWQPYFFNGTEWEVYTGGTPTVTYAVLSEDDTILTFYYDNQKENRNGMLIKPFLHDDYLEWYRGRGTITTVVFDDSFAACTSITSTAVWFTRCSNLTTIKGFTNLNTENVTDMYGMFSGCSSLRSLDLSHFNTANVTDMGAMFYNCEELKTIYVGSGWTTENVTNGSAMFTQCYELIGEKGTLYDMELVDYTYAHVDGGKDNPGYLSAEGSKEPSVPYAILSDDDTVLTFYYDSQKDARNGKIINPDYYKWNYSFGNFADKYRDVISVFFDASFSYFTDFTSTACLFLACKELTTITGLEYLNTENVTDMNQMFYGCSSLTELDVSHFNTDKVTNMNQMFQGCSSLTSLDISNFNTANLNNVGFMFCGCSSLTIIYGEDWDLSNVTYSERMFTFCTELVGGAGTKYSDNNANDRTYARIDGGADAPGYFTNKNALGIKELRTDKNKDMPIYKLSGIQSNKLDNGINIVDGKKYLIK